MKENSRGKKLAAFIAAVLIFLFLDPYFMWNLHNTTPLYAFLGVFLLLVFLPNADIRSKKRSGLFALFAFLLLLSTLYEDLNIIGVIGTICFIFVPFAKESFAKNTFNYFLTIYSVIVGISAVVWVLSLMGMVESTGVINPLNELKEYNYKVYPFLVRPNLVFLLLERFNGPFDEPGVIGTISALILTIGKFNLKDKRLLVVFLTGIISMSLFYYVIVALYYTIYTFTVSNDKKMGFLIIAVLAVLVTISLSNELVYDTVWSRLVWDGDSGMIAGDNRLKDSSRQLFDKVAGTTAMFLGTGKTVEFVKATEGNSSLLDTIVQYGLIYVMAYFYLFCSYGWKYKGKMITYILYLLVFAASIYQRPGLFQPEFLFLFSLMAMSCGDMLTSKKELEPKMSKIKAAGV